MKIIICCTAVAVLLVTTLAAENNPIWLSIGVKLGHTYGKGGGFTWGFEASCVSWVANESFMVGGVCDIDFCKERSKLHLGVEGGRWLIGADIGPTWAFGTDSSAMGLTVTPFVSLVIPALYYSRTFFAQSHLNELGAYVKFPMPINYKANHEFDWNND